MLPSCHIGPAVNEVIPFITAQRGTAACRRHSPLLSASVRGEVARFTLRCRPDGTATHFLPVFLSPNDRNIHFGLLRQRGAADSSDPIR